MKLTFKYKNKKIELDARKCNWFWRFKGLMFCRRKKAKALLFDFGKPSEISVHSFFVFFPFFAIWLDERNSVVDLKFIKPFRLIISGKKPFSKLIEIPVNERYEKIVEFLLAHCRPTCPLRQNK